MGFFSFFFFYQFKCISGKQLESGGWTISGVSGLVDLVHFSRRQFILSMFAETPTLYLAMAPLEVCQVHGAALPKHHKLGGFNNGRSFFHH